MFPNDFNNAPSVGLLVSSTSLLASEWNPPTSPLDPDKRHFADCFGLDGTTQS
jgi:hypothetical protein